MAKKQTEKNINLKSIEKLLNEQTTVILSAVDEKLQKTDVKILAVDEKVEALDRKISKLEIKVDQRFNQLKLDINRLKKVIQEKLGVDLS